MNKLFTKIASLTLGLAMAVGVGVTVGSAKASEAKADAASYVITFKDSGGTSDGTTKKTALADLVDSGSEYIKSLATTDNLYQAKSGYGIKGGGSSAKGVLVINWNTDSYEVKPTSIVAKIAIFSNDKDLKNGVLWGYNSSTSNAALSGGAELTDYTVELDGKTSLSTITVSGKVASNSRFYLHSLTINYDSSTPVCNHNWVAGTVHNPTCTEEGYTEYTCSLCQSTKHDDVVPATGHNYGDWKNTKDPDCTTAGEAQRVCANDSSHVETKVVPALGHSYVDGVCERCGAVQPAEDSVEYTFSEHYTEDTLVEGETIVANSYVNFVFTKREGGTDTKYYANGTAVRWYGGGTLVVNGASGNITKIEITYTQHANAVTADAGSYTDITTSNGTATWIGSTNKVTFTQDGTTGQDRISVIKITYDTGGVPPTPVETFAVSDSVEYGSIDVTSVAKGATLTAKITPESGYLVPESVSVTMGGESAQFTYANGVVTVANVQGDIVISGTCPAVPAGDLPNGSYEATLGYVNPISSSIAIMKDEAQTGKSLTVTNDGVTYDDTHKEYKMNKDKYIMFENQTNAVFTKIEVEIYNYDNFNIYVDGSETAAYTGEGKNKGDHYIVEVNITGSSSIKVVGNGGDNGSRSQAIYSIKVYLKVGNDPIPVTGVTLNAEKGYVFIGKTRQLVATVAPSNADNTKVSWSSSDENVATVSATGLVSGKAKGSATITVETEDGHFTAKFVASVQEISYGTAENPLSVEMAREVLEASGSSASAEKLYVKGEVYSSKYYDNNKDYTIWLTNSDKSVDKYFELYAAEIPNAITEDDAKDDALKGITVVAVGYGKIFNGTYELCKNGDDKPQVSKYAEPAEQYLVTFAENGKYFPDMYDAGEQITIANYHEELVPDGKSFDHWEDEQKVSYQPGDKYTVNGAVTFTAVYVDSDWSSSFKSAFQEKFNVSYPPYINAEFAKEENIVFAENEKLCTISVSGDHVNEVKAKYVNWTSLGKTNDGQDLYKHPTADLYMSVSYVQETVVKFQVKKGAILDATSVKKDFYVGDSIDTTGLKVFYTLVDGSYSENLPVSENSWSASPSKFNTAGNVDVTVSVTGLASPVELKYQVVVLAVQVAKIEISGAMIKTSYTTEDDWNPNGFIVLATYNNGSQEYVTSNVQWSYSPEKPTTGVKLVTATASFGGVSASKDTAVTIYEVYKAENFAEDFLALVAPICNNYDGKTSNKEALKSVWYTMAERYNVLDNDEKVKVIKSASKVDGTALERAMAFYDYACKKYGLKPFVENRTINSLVFETQTSNSILPIIVIVVASLAAVTSIGLIIAYKRRKNLYMK